MSIDCERLARSFIKPLGFPEGVEWGRVWVGNETDTTETGSLECLCKSLGAAVLADIAAQGFVVVPRSPDERALLEARDALIEALNAKDDDCSVQTSDVLAVWKAFVGAPG